MILFLPLISGCASFVGRTYSKPHKYYIKATPKSVHYILSKESNGNTQRHKLIRESDVKMEMVKVMNINEYWQEYSLFNDILELAASPILLIQEIVTLPEDETFIIFKGTEKFIALKNLAKEQKVPLSFPEKLYYRLCPILFPGVNLHWIKNTRRIFVTKAGTVSKTIQCKKSIKKSISPHTCLILETHGKKYKYKTDFLGYLPDDFQFNTSDQNMTVLSDGNSYILTKIQKR